MRKLWKSRTSWLKRHLAFETLEGRRLLAGSPIITEFMAINQGTLQDDAPVPKHSDWIEIYNAGDEPVDLDGWHLTDDPGDLIGWTFPDETLLPTGEFLVVFASGHDFVDESGNLHTDFSLKAEADYLALVRPDGIVPVSEFGPDGADYPHQYLDVSYGLVQEAAGGGSPTTRDDLLRYFLVPTPGEPNLPTAADLGPIISDVAHSPNVPGEGQDVVVSAAVGEAAGTIADVRLRYRVGFGGHVEVAMTDDATAGDAVAGDGVYTATIPAAGGAGPGEMVRWYTEASDTDGNGSRWPLFQKRQNIGEGKRQSEEYLGTVVADPQLTSQIPIYQLFIENPPAADVRSGTRASTFYDGEFYDNVFIRERGNSSAALPKTNHRINFNDDHLFRFDGETRLRKANFQADYIDPSYMRETLEAEVFAWAGVPSPLTQMVRLELNGEFFQLAGFIEHIDEDFLDRVGLDPDGALYKNPIMLNSFNVDNRGTWANAEKITRIDVDGGSKADLGRLAAGVDERNPDDQRATYIFDNVDIPAVINYMASFHVTQEADGMHINVMVYRDSDGTGEWRYLPFDMNFSFGQWFAADFITGNQERHFGHPFYGAEGFEPTVRAFSFNRLQDAIISTPETREMYLRRLRTLMDEFLQPPGTPFEELKIDNRILEIKNSIKQEAELDREKWAWPVISWFNIPETSFDDGVQQLFDQFLAERRVHLYETHSIDNLPDPSVPISIDTPAGIPHAQAGNPTVEFGQLEYNPVSGDQDQEYIELRNPNGVAVDLSGWRLSGGVSTTFQPGTVIPSGGTLYVTPDPVAFRSRTTGPGGGMRLFVQSYDRHLSNYGETITLSAADGEMIDEISYDGELTPHQLALRITEINYNPAQPTDAERAQHFDDNEDFEFIELQNTGSETLDMTGARFSRGIQFEFTPVFDGQPVLITEIGTGTPDAAEIQNVSAEAVDTTGWVVATNDIGGGINAVHDVLWGLPASIGGGEVLYRSDDTDDAEHYWGEDISWKSSDKGWVMIVDDHGNVADLVVWGYDDADVASLGVNVNGFDVSVEGAWSGPSVVPTRRTEKTLERIGSSEHDGASDWASTRQTSMGIAGTGLTLPFAGRPFLLEPGALVIVARNIDAFEARYGTGHNLAGQFASGRLDNGGETLKLEGPLDSTVLQFRYNDAGGWPTEADGAGPSLQVVDPEGDYEDPTNWRYSTRYGGSPGATPDAELGVVINEVLSHTDDPLIDAIELYNTTGETIDLGGWYVSDSSADFSKYRIAEGTSIPPGGYLVFDEGDFNPTPENPDTSHFALNGAHGDDVWLLKSDAAGEVTQIADHVEFAAAAEGESWGRWPNGEGDMVPMLRRTFEVPDGENSGPRIGPVLISEVYYNSSDVDGTGALEFIEIYNPTGQMIELDNWRIRKGIDFDFADGTVLAARSALLVVPFDPHDPAAAGELSDFVSHYQIDGSVSMVGGYSGSLDNAGETVQLQRGDEPPPDELTFIPHLLEDEVQYDDVAPWPTAADGQGHALHRAAIDGWGNDPGSWTSAAPTPGVVDLAIEAAVVGRHVFYNNSSFDADGDDAAMAPDKEALLPGRPFGGGLASPTDGRATFANYTSCVRGINGLMVDLVGLSGAPTAADFAFKVGNSDEPSTWTAAPAPQSVAVREGAGVDGSDRVTLIWEDFAIANQWLQVTVLATDHTGLAEPDVFYFGNAIGEAGNSTLNAIVNTTDESAARNFQHGLANLAAIDDPYDYNRDRLVNATDRTIARNNQTGPINALRLITVPAVDAAVVEALGQESPGKVVWLDELDQMGTRKWPSQKDNSIESRVDRLLAVCLMYPDLFP